MSTNQKFKSMSILFKLNKLVLIISILKIQFSTTTSIPKNPENSILKAVVIIYRHGDRAPKNSFPNDKYFHSNYWPMGFGQLTKFGIKRQYELGKWLRKRYKNFLNEVYTPEEIYVYSTDIDRTLMSAQVNLLGLYPPKKHLIWNENILWHPIPVHTSKRKKDEIIVEKTRCKKFITHHNKHYKTINENMKEMYRDIYEYIEKHLGLNRSIDLKDIKNLRSNMYCYKNYDKSFVPQWYTKINEEIVDYLAATHYNTEGDTITLARLKIGPILNYLINFFDHHVKRIDYALKFIMLSAHDTTLSPLMGAMGVKLFKPVHFADTIIWELKFKPLNNWFFINAWYKSEFDLKQLKIHGLDCDLDYNKFIEVMKNVSVTPGERLKECDDI